MVRKKIHILLLPLALLMCLGFLCAYASESPKGYGSVYSSNEKTEQVASFASRDKAVKLVKKLKGEGKDAFYTAAKDKAKKSYYRVFVRDKSETAKELAPVQESTASVTTQVSLKKDDKTAAPNTVEPKAVKEQQSEIKNTEVQTGAQSSPGYNDKSTPQPVLIDFRDYVNKALAANPSVKISEEDYRQTQIKFMRTLETYGINVSLNGSAGLNYDNGTNSGVEISLDASKNLYDGGKRQILEKELDIVKALAKANLLSNYDTARLSAAAYYADFYYSQEVLDFLKEQYNRQRGFIEKVERRFHKGVKFSIYDSLTAQNEYLQLEKDLLQQKANMVKTEISFRQFGHIYTQNPVKLAPLDYRYKPDIDYLQKYAVANNNSIFSARLQEKLQEYKVSERKAEGGIKVDVGASVKLFGGSDAYTGGKDVTAGVLARFTLPLIDGGVRKSDIVTEQIESLKQRLTLEKTTEDVIKRINEINIDYQNIEKSLEILQQQLTINEKRLAISLERLEKGLEEYRAVRESWDDLINTKITLIQQRTLSQKLLVDLLILSGKRLFD